MCIRGASRYFYKGLSPSLSHFSQVTIPALPSFFPCSPLWRTHLWLNKLLGMFFTYVLHVSLHVFQRLMWHILHNTLIPVTWNPEYLPGLVRALGSQAKHLQLTSLWSVLSHLFPAIAIRISDGPYLCNSLIQVFKAWNELWNKKEYTTNVI